MTTTAIPTTEETVGLSTEEAINEYGFDPAQPGAGLTPEGRAAIENFQKESTTNVPFDVQAEFVTNYGMFLVAQGKSGNESAQIAIEAMTTGNDVWKMYVVGAAYGMRLATEDPAGALLALLGRK